jgi:hypothetical protein
VKNKKKIKHQRQRKREREKRKYTQNKTKGKLFYLILGSRCFVLGVTWRADKCSRPPLSCTYVIEKKKKVSLYSSTAGSVRLPRTRNGTISILWLLSKLYNTFKKEETRLTILYSVACLYITCACSMHNPTEREREKVSSIVHIKVVVDLIAHYIVDHLSCCRIKVSVQNEAHRLPRSR